MKKRLYLTIFIFIFGLTMISPVFAETKKCVCTSGSSKFSVSTDTGEACVVVCAANGAKVSGATEEEKSVSTTGDTIDCGAFVEITKPLAQMIMIIAPILLLLFGTLDFTKAVAASDEKAIKKALSDFVKRLVICVLILILPVLINTLMGWIKFQDLGACW